MDASGVLLTVLAAAVVLRGTSKGQGYEAFVTGAREGLQSAVRLVPALCAMTVMVGVCRGGGLLDALGALIGPMLEALGFPAEALPVLLLRPVTGSGSLTMLRSLMAACGPDSRAARVAAVVCGSSETILYTMTLYLSAAGVSRMKRVLPVSLLAWGCGCLTALWCA